ncbi:MAG: type VI secretion system baseplate subunit TssG [Syntrophobacteraceae bacterium]|nr:type VI secretion system baseplate subunit TssG [Syntrophobacteraceae bacterium]
MAGEDGEQTQYLRALLARLEEAPFEFGFFQALRLIECLYRDAPRLGVSRRPAEDRIRLAQEPSMRFESASLTAFRTGTDGKPSTLTVRLFGLLGPNGPLPLHLTEFAQERLQKFKDPTFSRFLDMFHHRMLSFFYRAWANNEPTVSFDRPESDKFSFYLGSLEGLGMPALRNRDAISDWTKLWYCGLLAGQTKHPEGLEAILTDYFGLPAKLDEFAGEWVALPPKDVLRLGENPSNGTLGVSTILGAEVWSAQHKFRIILGPMHYADYLDFLPCANRIAPLVALVRNYAGDEWAWDVNLVLKREEVPLLSLDGKSRLGWTTWLGERTVKEDADDLVFHAPLSAR